VLEYAPNGTTIDYGKFAGSLGNDIKSLGIEGDLAQFATFIGEKLTVTKNITRDDGDASQSISGRILCTENDTSTPIVSSFDVLKSFPISVRSVHSFFNSYLTLYDASCDSNLAQDQSIWFCPY